MTYFIGVRKKNFQDILRQLNSLNFLTYARIALYVRTNLFLYTENRDKRVEDDAKKWEKGKSALCGRMKKGIPLFWSMPPLLHLGTTKLNFLPSPISFILQNTKRQFPLTGGAWTVCDCWLLNKKTMVYVSKMSHELSIWDFINYFFSFKRTLNGASQK